MSAVCDAGTVTQQLRDWILLQFPDIGVKPVSLSSSEIQDGIEIRLLGIEPRNEPRLAHELNFALVLDYLVTVRLPDPLAEHRCVAALALAGLQNPDFKLAANRSVADACRTLGLAASAGVIIESELRVTEQLRRAPLVREPAKVHLSPVSWLEGMVVAPNNQPIAGALVTFENSDRTAITGPDGRFRLAGTEAAPMRATARAHSVAAQAELSLGAPNIIILPLEI